ncbi:MAG: IS21 family transposase, partial [Actinobacteria bacterium]|nr:IS21 family transposase [Actinomycetota bacterium]
GLLGLPMTAFPAQLEVQRVVGRSALVAFEGNHYSVAPGLVGQTVTVRGRLGELHLEIISGAGRRVARHRRAPAGAGQLLRTHCCSSRPSSAPSRPANRAGARPTGRPATARSPTPPGSHAATQARSSSISRTTPRSRGVAR